MNKPARMKRAAILSITMAGCAVGGGTETLSSTESESFEQFRAVTYHEDFEGGVYIVDGDTPIVDDKALYEFWELQQHGAIRSRARSQRMSPSRSRATASSPERP